MFNYDFISLTPAQLEWRRAELDRAGTQAITAPIIVFTLAYIYRKVNPPTTLPSARSILDSTFFPEYGTLRVQLITLLYTAFLLWRIQHNTGNDYMHVTKAFGHVAVIQLILQVALSFKHLAILETVTGSTHERLNGVHRLFGRVVCGLLFMHAGLYLNFFAKQGLLLKRVRDADVQLGLLAVSSLGLLVILALPAVRKRAYHRVFYRSHVVLSFVLIVAVWFHVTYTRVYVVAAGGLWVANGVFRWTSEGTVSVKCREVGGLIRVEATHKSREGMRTLGRHLYLKDGWLGPRTPFSIVSMRQVGADVKLELVVKYTGGPMTQRLGSCAKQGRRMVCKIEGPYGEAELYMDELLKRAAQPDARTLLVAGGVGATYILPIYKALREQGLKAGQDIAAVKALWIVKRVDEIEWANELLTNQLLIHGLSVHVTQESFVKSNDARYSSLLSKGRPQLTQVVQDHFSTVSSTKTISSDIHGAQNLAATILVCGPTGLSTTLKDAVSNSSVLAGQDVCYLEEQFGFGGS